MEKKRKKNALAWTHAEEGALKSQNWTLTD